MPVTLQKQLDDIEQARTDILSQGYEQFLKMENVANWYPECPDVQNAYYKCCRNGIVLTDNVRSLVSPN